MTMFLNPKRLTINTSTVHPPQHRRSKHQFYAPSPRHGSKRISDAIPCTCSESHIIAQPGTPCLIDVLSPSANSRLRRPKRLGSVTPVSYRSVSTISNSLSSVEESEEENQHDAVSSIYYSLNSSDNSIDHPESPRVASEIHEAVGQADSKKPLLDDFDLPFVQDDDFNYYPERSPRTHGPTCVVTEKNLILGNELNTVELEKSNQLVKGKLWHDSYLEKKVARALRKLGLKQL